MPFGKLKDSNANGILIPISKYGNVVFMTLNVFLDFDDVINIEGFRAPKYRNKLAPTDLWFDDNPDRSSVTLDGMKWAITWFPGVARYFSDLRDAGANVMWLSTWERDTGLFASKGMDFPYVPWDPTVNYGGWGGASYSTDDIVSIRNSRKLDAVKDVTDKTGLPFVWIDDTATTLWKADDFDVRSLGLVIDTVTGFDKSHAKLMDDFIDSL